MMKLAFVVALSQAGCFWIPALQARAFKQELERAPVIPNPATTGQVDNSMITAADGTTYRLTAFNAQAACFDVVENLNPRAAQRLGFALQSYVTAEDKDDTVMTQRAAPVRVVASQSHQEPVQRTVHDTMRDSSGQVIATTDRQVTEMVTVYETELEVCIAQPRVITAQTGWMVLREYDGDRYSGFGAWKLYDPNGAPPAAAPQAKEEDEQPVQPARATRKK